MASVMLVRPLAELEAEGLVTNEAAVDSTGGPYELPAETDGVEDTMLM